MANRLMDFMGNPLRWVSSLALAGCEGKDPFLRRSGGEKGEYRHGLNGIALMVGLMETRMSI